MPLLAEIADKMPTLETVWMTWTVVGLVAAAVTVVLALLKLWIGAAAVTAKQNGAVCAFRIRIYRLVCCSRETPVEDQRWLSSLKGLAG